MNIKMKSNRKFMMPIAVTFMIFCILLIIISVILNIVNELKLISTLEEIWIIIILMLLDFTVILFIKGYNGKKFIFNDKVIEIYKKDVLIDSIKVNDIEVMNYYEFKYHYFFTIMFGTLNEGGLWKIHVRMKNKSKIEIGFLSLDDVQYLKTNLYGEMIVIK